MSTLASFIGQRDTTVEIQTGLPGIRIDIVLPERRRIIGTTVANGAANSGPRKNEDMCGDVEEAILRKTTAGADPTGTMKMRWVRVHLLHLTLFYISFMTFSVWWWWWW